MTISLSEDYSSQIANPLENIELVLGANGWPYERMSEEEISATVKGKWCEYFLRFYWQEEGRILQLACILDLTVPVDRKSAIFEALSKVNERIWIGHFEIWEDDSVIMFRHATLAEDSTSGVSSHTCGSLVDMALSECERFYPVFQFVAWTTKTPTEAITSAMLNTSGEA